MAYPRWTFISIVVCAVLLAVVLAVFRTKLRTLDVFSAFLLFGAAVLSVLIVLYTRSLQRAQQIQLDTDERLQEMADNIQEIVWMIDAETKKALYVNAAYETITGRSCQSLLENPSSHEDLIHPEDRVHVLTKLGEATQTERTAAPKSRKAENTSSVRSLVLNTAKPRRATQRKQLLK